MQSERNGLNLPESIQNSGLILLNEFNEYFSTPNQKSLVQWEFHDKHGVRSFITRIAGRVYVKIPEFLDWLENQEKAA